MAGALVSSIDFDSSADNLTLVADVLFFGVGLKDRSVVSVTILPSDAVTQIKSKLVNAVLAEATALGYSVSANSVILPVFQRG